MAVNWIAVSASLIAGISTAFGALPIFIRKDFSKSFLNLGMGFSAGVMLVASFVSLILPGIDISLESYSDSIGILPLISGVLVGYFFIINIHDLVPHEHLIKKVDMNHGKTLSRTTLIILAIALHNIPEGLAVGIGFADGNTEEGLSLAIAIAIQNMPEGLVVALGLLSQGSSKAKAFLMSLLSGLVEPVFALLGFISTQVTAMALPILLGFAGGAMLFVICQEIFPEIFREGHERQATRGVIIGVISMLLINHYF